MQIIGSKHLFHIKVVDTQGNESNRTHTGTGQDNRIQLHQDMHSPPYIVGMLNFKVLQIYTYYIYTHPRKNTINTLA